jgi:ABC-2 type transport system ATP-binding protein
MESIVCNGIGKIYGKKQVLKNINLTLEKGKIYGLIGRNGAGKTTLLSIMSAQNPASEGTVTWNGENVWENRKALKMTAFSRHLLYRHSSHNREFHNANCRFCGAFLGCKGQI